jgi:hypothetical protein
VAGVERAVSRAEAKSKRLLDFDRPDGAGRDTPHALVAHGGKPGQFLVQLLVVLVVGEIRRLDPEEVGQGRDGPG